MLTRPPNQPQAYSPSLKDRCFTCVNTVYTPFTHWDCLECVTGNCALPEDVVSGACMCAFGCVWGCVWRCV